jgi:Protein of unknown function, DUF488
MRWRSRRLSDAEVVPRRQGKLGHICLQFRELMAEREIERTFRPEAFAGVCLLCSETTPHQCRRRLICEYLNGKWTNTLIVRHL